MKNILLVLLLASVPFAGFAGNKGVEQAAGEFFDAIRAGDVTALQSMIGGTLSEQISGLLKNNASYPETLRRHYNGSSARLGEVVPYIKGDKQIDLYISFSDGRAKQVRLTLSKKQSPDWLVIEQQEIMQ